MIYPGITPVVCDVIRPRPFVRTVDWAAANITLPPGSELRGKFRPDLFPHMIEPLDCFDDPFYRTITMQFASRLGKTVGGQVCIAKTATVNPNPMAWADADERSVKRVVKRTWRILEKIPGLADRVPPRRLQASDGIQLADSIVHGAWSGSPSAAADYAALVIVMNEIDKMSRRKSDEADFAMLMEERAKGFCRSKIFRMSTPGYKGRSRVEAARLAGDNRGRWCPCPFCNGWQLLKLGNGREPGGIGWEKLAGGRSDPAKALATAWYECEHCRRKIGNEHRHQLLNDARWVKAGQTIHGSGTIKGKPLYAGPDASFGPLSTLYSLLPSITWGVIAKKFLEALPDREAFRNFWNSWLGLTWDPNPERTDLHVFCERLCRPYVRGVCPEWVRFLTLGIDVGEHATEFWYTVCGWGLGGRGCVVDWGMMLGEDDLRHLVLRTWPHADGGLPLRAVMSLIDSGDGNHTDTVYDICRRIGAGLLPCKGSKSSGFPETTRLSNVREEPQTAGADQSAALVLVTVNTERTQQWIQKILDGVEPADGPYGLTLPDEARMDLDFVDQLLNEFMIDERNENGYTVHSWKKRGKNELRDAPRYARAAAMLLTKEGKNWDKLPSRSPAPAPPPPARESPRGRLTTPDGRPFLATER